MNPTTPTNGLYSILKVAILTACGAFFGAFSMTGVPTSWAEAKTPLLSALGSALAAEIYYLRSTFGQLLAQAGGALPPPASPGPSTSATVAAAATKALMAIAMLVVFGALLACVTAAKVVPPAVASVGCVVDDAVAGKSLSQIEQDCGGDVAQLVGVLIDPTTYAKVKDTPAYAETQRVKLALKATP